jgi:uncharacterized protein (DUF1697 family)
MHIALLRAVNLGPHNKVGMADLRALAAALGLKNPQTLLQSGNLVFEAGKQTPAQLEQLLERGTATQLAVETDFFVRTAKEWRSVIDANPFPREAKSDPGHVVVMALKAAPTRAAVAALQDAIKGREVVRAEGRHAYFVYPDGIGSSKLTIKMIEKAFGTRGTARNWNTVLKLGALTG